MGAAERHPRGRAQHHDADAAPRQQRRRLHQLSRQYREAFRAVGVGRLITHYENNQTYVDEAPRLYLNAIKFNSETAQVVLDLTRLEDSIVNLQGRDVRIKSTKFQLKTVLITSLLCGCSFTLGIKFATILMKKNSL